MFRQGSFGTEGDGGEVILSHSILPSAAAASAKHSPENINKRMSRVRNKSKLGLRVALKKPHKPEQHASRIDRVVVVIPASPFRAYGP